MYNNNVLYTHIFKTIREWECWHFWDGRQAGDRTTFFNTRIKKVIRNQFMHLIIINYGWPEQLCSTCSIIHYILIGNRWTTEQTIIATLNDQKWIINFYLTNYLFIARLKIIFLTSTKLIIISRTDCCYVAVHSSTPKLHDLAKRFDEFSKIKRPA